VEEGSFEGNASGFAIEDLADGFSISALSLTLMRIFILLEIQFYFSIT
jgi:hypothetical protein